MLHCTVVTLFTEALLPAQTHNAGSGLGDAGGGRSGRICDVQQRRAGQHRPPTKRQELQNPRDPGPAARQEGQEGDLGIWRLREVEVDRGVDRGGQRTAR